MPAAPAVFLGDDAERLRILAVARAIRDCPHRTASTCAGRARCALGRGRGGRVERKDCEACVLRSGIPDGPEPPESGIPDLPMTPSLPESPVIFDANDRPLPLAGTRQGRAVALFCGGPSLATLDLAPFMSPWSDRAAVNNAGALVRPHWWFSVDSPSKFHDSIWRDPAVTKFAARQYRQYAIREKSGGKFLGTGLVAASCPSVAFYRRHGEMDFASWPSETTLSWGCAEDRSCTLGRKGCRSVLFVALKLLLVLGYRDVFLLGCDWEMDINGAQYGFGQSKDAAACASNNRAYETNGARLAALRPIIESLGARIVNATPGSHLDAFDRVSPADAAEAIEAANRPELDLAGWY